MITVKLVVIGPSGVGKTSLRGQYISGRFSTGYRATLGADFISKTLPHPTNPDGESVTLQIWDTAGQERFSSLSSAFFRGADAALLMFDTNAPPTLPALTHWWDEFRTRAPVRDEDAERFCIVVVGNKVDLSGSSGEDAANVNKKVTDEDVYKFVDELVPRRLSSTTPNSQMKDQFSPPISPPSTSLPYADTSPITVAESSSLQPPAATQTHSIAIHPVPKSKRSSRSASRSRSSSRFHAGLGGTMTTMRTSLSAFHTPASSYFDVYESARSSPVPGESPPSSLPEHGPPNAPRRMPSSLSNLSLSSGSTSGVTITPSLFARGNGTSVADDAATPPTPPSPAGSYRRRQHLPSPETHPKIFFTSAKTGEGVQEVFEYVVRRVVGRWEWEEAEEAGAMHILEGSSGRDTIRLGGGEGGWRGRTGDVRRCCS